MRIELIRIFICAAATLALSACNVADDSPPQVGNSGSNNANNTSANSSTANNTTPNGGTTDAGNNGGTGGCTTDDLTGCPSVTGAEASQCIEGICIYQCQPGLFDENQDLEQPDSDGCESDCVPTNGGTEICDGQDNDCNGVIDDDFGTGNTCSNGVGVCEANGRIACDADGMAFCDAVEGMPGDEVCDGMDNDCDGEVDEGNPGGGGTCDTGQPGACQNGTESCAGGQIVCEPNAQPVDEACGADNTGDGVDNDCDGEVDEDCGNCPEGSVRDCYTGTTQTQGVGQCEDGQQQCLNGNYQMCLGETLPAPELCDGLDNNCDGTIDDGYAVGDRCTIGVGECVSGGSLVCSGDGRGTECNAQPIAPSVEICDAKDNDCDGSTDEDFPNLGKSCTVGVGACRRTGNIQCESGGTAGCSATPGIPGREICGDRIDNDCDGLADEGCSGTTNCSPACRLLNVCCSTDGGRSYSCYSRPPLNAVCEPQP